MFLLHDHTDYSNGSRGFSDSSIKLKDLIKRAKELGLEGVAITDHEITSSFIKAKKLEKELDFPVLLGNEIYLITPQQDDLLRNNYGEGMYFPHFVLIALDKIGVQQLWELSSRAWLNSFTVRGLTRTTTLTTDVEEVIGSNKGHVVGMSACLGGQLSKFILTNRMNEAHGFIDWCQDTFGKENFFLECQPATAEQEEQLKVNNVILDISKERDIPYVITTDSHYLKKEDLSIHSAFLNSKDGAGEREVEAFYRTAYVMGEEEIKEYFKPYWNEQDIQKGIDNTKLIGSRLKPIDFNEKQHIPQIQYDFGWKVNKEFFPKDKEYINKFIKSEYEQDKYLMYLIEKGMKKRISSEDYKETFDRVEMELVEFWLISQKLSDRLGSYFVTMNKIIEIIWTKGDSLVGDGRGSGVSSIINYLLEITDVNPLKMPVEMPFFRFIDRNRLEIPDIDIDTQSDRRKQILNAVKDYFEGIGGEVVNCCTFGTLGAKSAIQIACKGLGYPSEEALNISALIPTERGFTWSLEDCYYGNEKEDRKPIHEFKRLVDGYDKLWETALLIEGLIVNRGTHASGVFVVNDKFEKVNSKMKSPDGTITSQYDLGDSEQNGLIKYDFLTTSAMTKIRLTMEMLIEHGYIKRKQTLRDTYLSVLAPDILDYDYPEVWKLIEDNEVVDLFQFDSDMAIQTVKKIKPKSLLELAQSNSLMRLMPKGLDEMPVDTYSRFKNDISLWYKEMDEWGVPKTDQEVIAKTVEKFKGVCDTQESIMLLSIDEKLTNFSITESHKLRKGIAKKNKKVFDEVEQLFYKKGYENGVNKNTLDYIWKLQIGRQKLYSFSILHTIAYTFIALQELVLYSKYPSIYWNTACLTINAGATEEYSDEIDVEESEEKKKSTKYGKIAKAIGEMQQRGVTISPPYINKANFSFTPDEENNSIIFGLKGISEIGDDVAHEIINNRPFESLEDFYRKMVLTKKIGKTKVINLIKAGCFDDIEGNDREALMRKYIGMIYEKKNSLSTSNLQMIINMNIVPDELSNLVRLFRFRKYIFRKEAFYSNHEIFKSKKYYMLDDISIDFFNENFINDMQENKHYKYNTEGKILVVDTEFDAVYKNKIEKLSQWLKEKSTVSKVNEILFNEEWEKYCKGNISKWEMDSVCYYSHEHELKNVNFDKYDIADFSNLDKTPVILNEQKRGNRTYITYKLDRIVGTVLDKNKTKHTVSLLTMNGVVTIKLYSGAFANYDKQIKEEVIEKGKSKQKIIEKSWFTRGEKLMITGFRRDEQFIPKKYRNTIYRHTIQKIIDVKGNGDLVLQSEREGFNE